MAAEATGPAPTPSPEAAPRLPVTVTGRDDRTVTVTSADRIIPLDGDVAEVVFALGLGDRVVATDLSATYPPAADALPEIGYQRALSAEPIAAFEPTVVLGTDIAGPPGALDDLRQLGIPVVIVPNPPTPDGPAEKITAVAEALGVPGRGAELAGQVQHEIEAAMARVEPQADPPRVLSLYIRGEGVQFALGTDSPTSWLIDAAGGVSLAEELGLEGSTPLSGEFVLRVAPDVLVVPEAGLASVDGADGLLESRALGRTPAGQDERVLSYDDQLLLGNGPRTGQLLDRLIDDLGTGAPS